MKISVSIIVLAWVAAAVASFVVYLDAAERYHRAAAAEQATQIWVGSIALTALAFVLAAATSVLSWGAWTIVRKRG
jgi:hypothetical protein